jgi:hypothetical protein
MPLSEDGMIESDSTTLQADSQLGSRGRLLPCRGWRSECGEFGRECSDRATDGDRARHRGVTVVRADRRL